jgi:predicted RNase H-like HicB family nuclease
VTLPSCRVWNSFGGTPLRGFRPTFPSYARCAEHKMDTWRVTAFWDEEAKVWVAESDEVPGLATEATTLEALVEKLKIMIPELLDLNGMVSVFFSLQTGSLA